MRKFRFISNKNENRYVAFADNSIIEVDVLKNEEIIKDRNYTGVGTSVNTGNETSQIIKGRDIAPLENNVKRL